MAAFVCEFCHKGLKVIRSLKRHIRLCHDGPSTLFKCIPCNRYFLDQLYHQQHILQHSKIGDGGETIDTVNFTGCNQQNYKCVNIDDDEVKCVRSVFKNRIITYSIDNNNNGNLMPENF